MTYQPVVYRIVPAGGPSRKLAIAVLRNAGARGRGDKRTITKERTGIPLNGVTPHRLFKLGILEQIVDRVPQATTR